MITKNTLQFLKDLEQNNNRDWFQSHKAQYESAKNNFADFITVLINHIAMFDEELFGTLAAECTFRIFRDVRFAKNKAPYKSNFGAYMAPGGRKSMRPGYYIHLDPAGSFIAGGAYCPEPPQLFKIRQSIATNTREFYKIIGNADFKRMFGEISPFDSPLVNVPKGFPKDHEAAEYLKYKSYIVSKKIKPSECNDIEKLAAQFHVMKPLNDFLRRALA